VGDEDDVYRAKLAAQTMRWRLAIGVGSWGVALASAAFVGLVMTGESMIRIQGRGRLLAYAIPMIVSLAVAGWVMLRVGEIDLQTGRLRRAPPVPWSKILGLVTVVALAAGLVIAWPLGVYTSIRASRSACGQLVPLDVLRAHTALALSYASVTEDDGCDVVIVSEGHAASTVLLRQREVPDDHEWRSQLTRFHPETRERLYVTADEAVLLENDDVLVIALRRGTEGSFVQLRREAFDVDDAIAIAGAIAE
jgi:hypothetical protein